MINANLRAVNKHSVADNRMVLIKCHGVYKINITSITIFIIHSTIISGV